MVQWHTLPASEALRQAETTLAGLTDKEVELRRTVHGLNELTGKKKKSPWMLFLLQFTDFMILVLMVAAIISGIAGDITDTIIILVIIFLNALIGFFQEYRAEKALEALKKIASFKAHVLRNGNMVLLPSSALVPGDIVVLEAGNVVPADLRLLEAFALRIDESALTGESVPAEKGSVTVTDPEAGVADRLNMAYKSTLVANGRATGVVIATGMATEIGRIAQMLDQKESTTPLQRRMADFGKKLSYIILFICAILFVAGWLRGEEPIRMLLLSISLAVAAIPEALPALITIALARGARRLVTQHALVRKLPAVETLGSVSFICTDKTGTLTQNKMTVTSLLPFAGNGTELLHNYELLHALMALNTDVRANRESELSGDPTELAMIEWFCSTYSIDRWTSFQKELPRVGELPFDSDRKCMTTVHQLQSGYLSVSKGAVEAVVASLRDSTAAEAILKDAQAMAAQGIRVLAFAYKRLEELPEPFSYEKLEAGLEFGGLTGLIDPPREEAAQAIKECKEAGIHPVMITGDHPSTAAAIARTIGILGDDDLILTGKELQKLSPSEFDNIVERVRVYARVSPEQKLNIVTALQGRNHFVSMTGDGVNDAPSLKAANIGVAMGINGTDVSKEAADMILLDDNFATIVKAVKEGRRIYDNIRKFVKYIMTCNGAEIWTLFLAPLLGLPIPLLPIHILWINLVTDGLPGLALAGEKAEGDIMQRPPRKPGESLFSEGIGYHIVWVGLLMAGVTLFTQAWALAEQKEHWQTMVFTVLSLAQLGHVMAIRSERQFLFRQGILSNLPLLGAISLTFLLQMAVIYLPLGNQLFKTQPLTLNELGICLLASAVVFHAVELEKLIKQMLRRHRQPQRTHS